MRLFLKALGFTVVLLASICHGVKAQTRSQQEALFLREIASQPPVSVLKLAVALEVLRDDKRYIGNIHLPFRSADKIRFHFLASENAFLYLLLLKGSRGTSCVLFPLEETGLDNFIARGQVAIVPQFGALEFDKVTGYEEVGILCSRERLDPRQFLEEPSVFGLKKKVISPASAHCIEGSGNGLRILPSVLALDSSPFQEASSLIHDQGSILLEASARKVEKRRFTRLPKSAAPGQARVPSAASSPSSALFYPLKLLHQ